MWKAVGGRKEESEAGRKEESEVGRVGGRKDKKKEIKARRKKVKKTSKNTKYLPDISRSQNP